MMPATCVHGDSQDVNAIGDFKYAMTAHYKIQDSKKFQMRTMVRCLALFSFINNYEHHSHNSKNARQSQLGGMTICMAP